MWLRKYAVKWYFVFPLCFTSAFALPGETRTHENCMLTLECFITAFPGFNQSLLDFFQLFGLATHIYAAVGSESCNQLSSALACWGHSSGEMK